MNLADGQVAMTGLVVFGGTWKRFGLVCVSEPRRCPRRRHARQSCGKSKNKLDAASLRLLAWHQWSLFRARASSTPRPTSRSSRPTPLVRRHGRPTARRSSRSARSTRPPRRSSLRQRPPPCRAAAARCPNARRRAQVAAARPPRRRARRRARRLRSRQRASTQSGRRAAPHADGSQQRPRPTARTPADGRTSPFATATRRARSSRPTARQSSGRRERAHRLTRRRARSMALTYPLRLSAA